MHFAIDLSNVYMTTKLEGANTYFLPFNQGSNGAGNVGGKGNPVNSDGYDTAYLWEQVLCKERLLEILHKYLHLQVERDEKGNMKSERMIFPRYHQLDVVTKLLADVTVQAKTTSFSTVQGRESLILLRGLHIVFQGFTTTKTKRFFSLLLLLRIDVCLIVSCRILFISLTTLKVLYRK